MVKSEEEVVKEFSEIVNMTADELDDFLKTEGSESTGWSKDDGSGESIGHESGRKIVDILRRNPDKDESKYTDEDKEHMRRVVSYCKRHLAQEEHLKQEKSPEELEKSKSTRSLKNWGHDPMKTLGGAAQSKKPASKKGGKPPSKKESAKPASKKGGKPASKKEEDKKEDKIEEKDEEKEEDGKEEKKDEKEAEDEEEAEADSKDAEDAEAGDKRAADEAPKSSSKPASKKAKTAKPASEGTRKPPSRSAKKA